MNLQRITDEVISWLIAHGFQPNNREWVGLILLVTFAAFVIWNTQSRSALFSAIKTATGRKLLALWAICILWMVLFVLVTDTVGIWNPVLTKDTFIWGVSSGLVLLGSFTEATKIGHFKDKATEIVGGIVIIECFMNLSPFSIPIEFVLQVVLLIAIVLPAGASNSQEEEIASKVRIWTLAIASAIVVIHTLRTADVSWGAVDWQLLVIKMVWPMLLGLWILTLIFPLSIYAAYEEVFLRIDICRSDSSKAWRAKIGVVLALGIRLKLIREAAKGGGMAYDVAHTNSIGAAYEEAKRHRLEDES